MKELDLKLFENYNLQYIKFPIVETNDGVICAKQYLANNDQELDSTLKKLKYLYKVYKQENTTNYLVRGL